MSDYNRILTDIEQIYHHILDYIRETHQTSKIKEENREKYSIEAAYKMVIRIILTMFLSNEQELKEILYQFDIEHTIFEQQYSKIKNLYPYSLEETLFEGFKPPIEPILQLSKLILSSLGKLQGLDLLGDIYENILTQEDKRKLGLFYTPRVIVDYILDKVDYNQGNILGKKILDPACGSGGFLVRAVNRHIRELKNVEKDEKIIIKKIIDSTFGMDLDPFAIFLAESNIIFQLSSLAKRILEKEHHYKIPKLNLFITNSINRNRNEIEIIQDIKRRKGRFEEGFEFIVGNPPYIEAKKMTKETKLICKKNFPNIAKGAFDIFVCFMKLGLDLLRIDGKLGFIIPNKFLTSRYGKTLRKFILSKYKITNLVDVSQFPVFRHAMVYPIIATIQNNEENEDNMVSVQTVSEELSQINSMKPIKIPQKYYSITEGSFLFFLPEDEQERNIILKVLNEKEFLLGEILKVRWSVSFHRAGLREKFVFNEKKGKFPRKFLGGKSFGGNSEIQRYSKTWKGYWIDYNRQKAKELKNPFPKTEIFDRSKIIFCQNSKRIRCTIDEEGFVCKDIFFVANANINAKERNISEKMILAVLNSKLISFFYAKMFVGTHVAGNYLHYLPMYLHSLPFPILRDEKKKLDSLVKEILNPKIDDSKFNEIDNQIDSVIYKVYNFDKDEIKIIDEYVKKNMELKKQP